MKKLSLKSKILLGAILMGGTFAGAHAVVNTPDAQEERYDWTGTPAAPDNPNQPLSDKTVQEAQRFYGCDGDADICATGTPVSGIGPNATINLQ